MSQQKVKIPERSNKLVDTKDLLFVWKLLTKNILIILLFPLLAYVVGYIYTHRLSYKYGAKVQLLLKSGDTYDYQDQIYQGLGAYGMYMDVQNQMRILKSRDLIGEVVDKINANTSYYVVGRIKKREVYETLPFKSEVVVFNESIFEAPITVEVVDMDAYKINFTIGEQDHHFNGVFGKELSTPFFHLKLNKSYTYDEENIDIIRSSTYEIVFHSRSYLISKYQSAMTIENLEHTSILEVSVIDELSPRAMVFLDTLTAVYIDYSKRIQLEVNQNTLDNIQKQIDTVSMFIDQKEEELLSYKDKNSILNPEKEEEVYLTEYFEVMRSQRELQKQKSSAIALKGYMTTSSNEHLLPPSFYIEKSDLYLAEAVAKIRTMQLDLEILLTSAKTDNQIVKNKRDEISMLKGDIITYIDNLMVALDGEIEEVKKTLGSYKGTIKQLPQSEQGISNIQRELDVNNKMFLFLLEKKTNTLIARAGIIPQVRLVESTTPLGVIEPNKTKIIRLFVLGGFVIALLIALIRKLFFEKITNTKELAENTDLSVIGGVPYVSDMSDPLIVLKNPKSNVTESFRSIRTNLLFLGEGGEDRAKKIMISSFYPQEGKTFCSTNISSLLSRGDKKTLMIDFDLHRPKIHKTFKLENTKGVSSYIIGNEPFENIVNKDVAQNLDIITAGPISPNPSELIIRDKVDELIKEAESKYDYVILDTAPFGLLNDSLELAKKVDVFLVIFNSRYSRRRGIQHVEEMLDKFEDVSIGVILNGIKMRRLQYYYAKYTYKYTYSYGYGYDYGYGYGYGKDYSSDPTEE